MRSKKSSLSQCLISFGSNLGDRADLIAEAARRVRSAPLVESFAASRLFETPPIGGPNGQAPFLNAVATFETTAPASEVLQLLQSIETELGRIRRRRWDSRSIDLDVVLHGELIGGNSALVVPHPRYTARQFVLKPACDVASHFRDPRFGWTLQRLSLHLNSGNASLSLIGGDDQVRRKICERLSREHRIKTFVAINENQPRIEVLGNAPSAVESCPSMTVKQSLPVKIEVHPGEPWVSSFVPDLPTTTESTDKQNVANTSNTSLPRLVARLQRTTSETRWPAPHQIFPSGLGWPEYRLELDDLDWAINEIVSALDSMRCEIEPVTVDGSWWQ